MAALQWEHLKSGERKRFIWPAVGIGVGVLVAVNPFYEPRLTLGVGIGAWFVALAVALISSVHPISARIGCVIGGLFLAVPCFLNEPPVARGLLMVGMVFPLLVLVVALLAPEGANFRERLSYLFTWLGTREVSRRARTFDLGAVVQLVVAMTILAGAVACVKAVGAASGPWLVVRWLAGGIMILAGAEMVTASHELVTALVGVRAPALMVSPYLSTSLGEFWSKRWNPAASVLVFRPIQLRTQLGTHVTRPSRFVFRPLGLWMAFFASAVGHVLLPYMATGKWLISLACGAFFLVQPILIAAERRMGVRRWSPAAARVWTLGALAICAPLFVEPLLQILEPTWGAPETWAAPGLWTLAFVMGVNVVVAGGTLVTVGRRTKGAQQHQELEHEQEKAGRR